MLKFATGRSYPSVEIMTDKVEFIVSFESGKKGVFYKVSMSRLRNSTSDTGLVSQYSYLCTDTEYRIQLVAGRLTWAHLFSSNRGRHSVAWWSQDQFITPLAWTWDTIYGCNYELLLFDQQRCYQFVIIDLYTNFLLIAIYIWINVLGQQGCPLLHT